MVGLLKLRATELRAKHLVRLLNEWLGSRAARHAGLRVLLVDDNADATEILGEWLAEAGHQTRVARDGSEALSVAEQFDPDVVLLDICLPVMDGYEVARRLRESARRGHRVTIVALTGYEHPIEQADRAKDAFDQHIVKPFDLDMVQAVLTTRMAGVRT
jgi:CheY-like chemotaxis protein